MVVLWIVISTRWGLTSVQASLNVIVSVLGTIGLWAFTRFWWQRGCSIVLRKQTNVPLHKMFNIAGLGEGWDTITVLRRQIFAKQNWFILLQLVVVVGVTLTCALAGPIAKVSLKNGFTVRRKEIEVLPTVQGGGYFGNALFEEVLWNDTSHSLMSADFPYNQLLDRLPPPITPPWVYVVNEWHPTWTISCSFEDRVVVENMTGSGDHDFYHPLDAFPTYRDSFNSSWLDSPEYRVTSDFDSFQNWSETKQFREALFFTIVQSEPELNNRMLYNNETLEISISLLHAQDFQASFDNTGGVEGGYNWRPIGPVGHATYSRADCTITRKNWVEDESRIPWPWTNDTASVAKAYTTYYMSPFIANAVKKQTVDTPSARDLLRFYQIYMVSTNVQKSTPIPYTMSVMIQTVELSVVFLVILILLFLLTAWSSIRYAVFLRRHKSQLSELYLPDGRIEWMIHAVKTSEVGLDLESDVDGRKSRKDSEHFCTATIGASLQPGITPFDASIRAPKLARVQSCRSSCMSSIPSRRLSVSPARSNLDSVNESDQDSIQRRGRSIDKAVSYRQSREMSRSSHPLGPATEKGGNLPMVVVTTQIAPTSEQTVLRSRANSSTLEVPSLALRSFDTLDRTSSSASSEAHGVEYDDPTVCHSAIMKCVSSQ